MIKWLKRKIEIHNASLNYGNYEDHWSFESWLWFFVCGVASCITGLYIGFFITLWKQATVFIIGGILLMVYLCWQIELFSKTDIEDYNEEDFDPYHIDNIQFIWGIKSWDDFTSSEPNLHTMNDLDITYNKDTNLYYLGVETIYHFDEGKIGEVKYLNYLLEEFTKYMQENNYDTEYPYDFWVGGQIILRGKTISELYTQFRIFVEGYNVVYGGKENEAVLCE